MSELQTYSSRLQSNSSIERRIGKERDDELTMERAILSNTQYLNVLDGREVVMILQNRGI